METIKTGARGNLGTNPLSFESGPGGPQLANNGTYTTHRSSKVVYQHEADHEALRAASTKVALLTQFTVVGARWDKMTKIVPLTLSHT